MTSERFPDLQSFVNNQQRSHGHPCWLPHIHEETLSEPLCYSYTIPFASRYMTKLEERSLASMWNNFLNTSHQLSSLLVCLYSSFCIPVSSWLNHKASGQTIMDTVIPSGPKVNISSSWRSKSHSWTIVVTRHTIRYTKNLFYYFPVMERFI